MRALSRTLRLTTWPIDSPPQPSPASGAIEMRARVGLSPNRPQQDAGMRIEPPPSVACATGSMPATTAAAAPPDEPPGECSRFQGLRHGAVQARLGVRAQAELRRRAAPHDDKAGLLAARHVGAVVIGDEIGK